jgi:hypothetical protein
MPKRIGIFLAAAAVALFAFPGDEIESAMRSHETIPDGSVTAITIYAAIRKNFAEQDIDLRWCTANGTGSKSVLFASVARALCEVKVY